MHHSLRIYSKYRELFLRYYIFQAKWTKLPVIGQLVRMVANVYGQKASGAYLLTLNEAYEIVDSSEGVALGACTCRQIFHNCHHPINTEIMVGLTRNIFMAERPHEYQEITRDEAKAILTQCHQKGLMQTIIKCRQDFYAICNCCTCCCVPFRLNKKYGIGKALTRNENIVPEFKARRLSNPA